MADAATKPTSSEALTGGSAVVPADLKILAMGVHVLDVLVHAVESLPRGQDAQLVDHIRFSAAGTAGGTAVTLAKLGARVSSAGALGDDPAGTMLLSLLRTAGVDPTHLLVRPDAATSASVLPIHPNGDRPAFHVIGANGTYTAADVPWGVVAEVDHLHLGGPEFLGGPDAAVVLERARELGLTTSVDMLAPGDPGMFDWISPAWQHIDYLLPNRDQALGLTGEADIEAAGRALLAVGVGCVAITCGADGAVVVSADGTTRVPAFAADVVDTSGCGDAFSAGFLVGRLLGRSEREAAVLGTATAAQVVQGLGSDHGVFSLATVDDFAGRTATIAGASA
ncbi:MAG: sugar kinase [Frankiales bacterium]|nr:sugar kinase [Frankiales bacterium]